MKLFKLSALLVLSILFVHCETDDSEEEVATSDSLVGTWEFTSYTDEYDGNTYVYLPNQEVCEVEEEFCNNSNQAVEVPYCETYSSLVLVFNADNTFSTSTTSNIAELDYDTFYDTCEVMIDNLAVSSVSSGTYAVNTTTNTLSLTTTSVTYVENGETYTDDETSTSVQELTLDGNSLTISSSDEDGAVTIVFARS